MYNDVLDNYATRRDLEERGWTRRMVKRLLEPDARCVNDDAPDGALMNLYNWSQVEKAERSDEFKEMMERLHPDKSERLVSGTIRWANHVQLKITDNLSMLALANSLETEDGQTIAAFVRHNYTNYDKVMDLCSVRNASNEARFIVRLRLLRLIAKTYPALKQGCSRQWYKWYREDLSF